jgi:NodT family efflux transporter outer membrane factor (OMF) lipoprotein
MSRRPLSRADSNPVSNADRVSTRAKPARALRFAPALLLCFLSGCTVGPQYVKPSVVTPPAYKELAAGDLQPSGNWKPAEPSDAAVRGRWWERFQDPELNALEQRAQRSNQSLAAASASFFAARAAIRQARAQYFPTLAVAPSIVNSLPSSGQFGGIRAGNSNTSFKLSPFTNYEAPGQASWEPDFWGRIRNTTRGNAAAAQASAADLENVRLSIEAELAVDYYQLRGQDALKQVFDATVIAYREALDLANVQYTSGLDSDESVAQAEAQLEAAQAADTNLGILRAQYEHAIALLVGEPASTFSLRPSELAAQAPAIPVGMPADLLERRPDIASAERAVAQANAQIGVAKAAFFPDVTLGATAGFGTASALDWFSWPARFWSVGPSLTQTVFDAGLRRATVQRFEAAYDQTVANYRQSVLTAFQEVEDNIAALTLLRQQIVQQDAAVQSAQRSLAEAFVRYEAGIDPYLNVITAQTTLLNDQQIAVNFRTQQMVASVGLIKALGGDWDVEQLPSAQQLQSIQPISSNSIQ